MEKTNIGDFDTCVWLLKETRKIGTSGEVISIWGREKMLYATVTETDTNESTEDNNIIALTQIEVVTYMQYGVNQRWRIEYNGEVYNITSLTPVARSPFCRITAVKLMK